MLCQPLPIGQITAVCSCESFMEVLELVKRAKLELGSILSILEYMDVQTVQLVANQKSIAEIFGTSHFGHFCIIEVEQKDSI